ncbi:MAG: type IX secretion system membrane protein PorP/SprF [Bacteroidales bacterium]|nr:type IX secretion system membrane protein PorP/SprF [Bacteroidales bacterium]
MKTIIKTLALFFVVNFAYSQQDPQFNQYIFNNMIINPAYAGTKGYKNLSATFSTQWLGFAGAPSTQTISYDAAVARNTGLGVHLINDKIGAQTQQGIFGSYAHRVRLNDNLTLSLGLALGASHYSLDGTQLLIENENDPTIPKTYVNKLRFDSKSGFFLYTDRFYTGFSVTGLLADVMTKKELEVASQVRHYYLTAGYIFDINEDFKFKPSFLIKEDFKAPTNVDLTTFFLYKEKIWLGASLRTGLAHLKNKELDNALRKRNAVAVMTEWYPRDNFRIGYSYTVTISSLKNYSGHEIQLGYFFPEKLTPKMKTPRYF